MGEGGGVAVVEFKAELSKRKSDFHWMVRHSKKKEVPEPCRHPLLLEQEEIIRGRERGDRIKIS